MSSVQISLTTTGMQDGSVVNIYPFQFGTIPAGPRSYGQMESSVAAGSENVNIFWLLSDPGVPANQAIRFNLRFELNVHNSANLQVRILPAGVLQWRWSAPIGYQGTWSNTEQQAPWSDDGMDYCITIQPSELGIAVALSEHSATAELPCPFIPAADAVSAMTRKRDK